MSDSTQVDINSLSVQQISQLKRQLDEDVEQLASSFTQLHAAQAKFRECLTLTKSEPPAPSSTIMVPLTSSLYVKGRLSDGNRVLVDIGTGFYVEKDRQSAAAFYESKVADLGTSIQELEAIVQNKTRTLRMVEEVLRQKMQSG